MRDTIDVRFIPPTTWYKRAKWELLSEYTSYNGNVNVPTGFVTDGASIPWVFRWRFSPTGKYFGAAIVHDYILVQEEGWSKANDEFEKELKALNVNILTRKVLIVAVNVWPTIKRLFTGSDKPYKL